MRKFASIVSAMAAAACTTQVALRDARHVERSVMTGGDTLEVYSRRGIGSFALAPGARPPARICFRYDRLRAFGRLEGFELVRVADDGKESPVMVVIDGACVGISGAPEPGSYRVRFVDYYR